MQRSTTGTVRVAAMFNVMLDRLPEYWNGYPIASDFRVGIQISQCLIDPELSEQEKVTVALELLFPGSRPKGEQAVEALEWYLNEFSHDRHGKSTSHVKVMDFDVDQWRIYAAFRSQYGIDLNTVSLHWFEFMGLLSNLEECAFTRVIDIRQKKITAKMSREEKKAIANAKKVYALGAVEKPLTEEEKQQDKAALEEFQRMLNRKTAGKQSK